MRMFSHFLVGIILYILLVEKMSSLLPGSTTGMVVRALLVLVTLVAAFFSHWIVDWCSYLTFHPDHHFEKKAIDHAVEVVSGIIIAVMIVAFFVPYWPAMLASWAVDLVDWIVIRGLIRLGKVPFNSELHDLGFFHRRIDAARQKHLSWLPNLREKRWAIVNEFIIAGILFLVVLALKSS